jgi:hypothetical protein
MQIIRFIIASLLALLGVILGITWIVLNIAVLLVPYAVALFILVGIVHFVLKCW